MPRALLIACAVALLLGAAPLPYGYYTLLRLLACITFGLAVFVAHSRGSQVLPTVYGIAALLFNPLVPVHFSKVVWASLDIVGAILLLASARILTAPVPSPPADEHPRAAS